MTPSGMNDMGAERPALPAAAAGAGQSDDSAMGSEDCVPLSSLAMPDADNADQMANPEVGDKVNYQIEGTVTRIEGDNAYVKRDAINGDPVEGSGEDDGQAEPDADDQEGSDLRGMAEKMGGMQ